MSSLFLQKVGPINIAFGFIASPGLKPVSIF